MCPGYPDFSVFLLFYSTPAYSRAYALPAPDIMFRGGGFRLGFYNAGASGREAEQRKVAGKAD